MKNIISKFFLVVSFFILIPHFVLAEVEEKKGWNVGKLKDASNLPDGTVLGIANNVMLWSLGIVGFIAIIGFCIAGILYFISAGDEDQSKNAKRAMLYSIIGIIVALSGYVIWNAVFKMLDADGSQF